MAQNNEIKVIFEGFLSAKDNFDNRREAISTEKNTYDNGRKTLYQNWKGQAMNACIPITDKLNANYTSIIDSAEKMSKDMEAILKAYINTDNDIASTYKLGNSTQGEK